MMTDKELAQQAWAELERTTDSYPTWKRKGFPQSSHWAHAKTLLDQIGGVTPPPPTSTFPNAPGIFGQKAGPAGSDPSYGAAIRAATNSLILAGGDYGVPTWFAKATDPQVVAKQGFSQPPGYYGVQASATFRCPTNAVPAAGSDHHMVVVQPDGTWVEMYHAQRQQDGSWLSDGLGQAMPNQDSWSRDCCREAKFTLPAGIISLDEIAKLSIPHALLGIFPNAWGRDQVGKRMVLTGAIPTTLSALEKAVVTALQFYGLFVGDHTGGSDMSFQCQGGVVGYPSLSGLLPLLPNLRMVV